MCGLYRMAGGGVFALELIGAYVWLVIGCGLFWGLCWYGIMVGGSCIEWLLIYVFFLGFL